MTDKEILELAKTCGFDDFTGEKENFWECWEQQLLNFALAIHEDAYQEGYREGTYQESYHNSIQ